MLLVSCSTCFRLTAERGALRSRDPFGVVLKELRSQIRRGDIAPGEPLIVMDLAGALALSATPVREALAYLAGEGLIDGRRGKGRGYATWRLGAPDLADLYRLHAVCVQFAIGEAARRESGLHMHEVLGRDLASADAAMFAVAAERLFEHLVHASGSEALRRTQRSLADRLHLPRLVEHQVLSDVGEELCGLAALEKGGGPLIQAVRIYHRRRIADAERLALAVAARRT